MALIKCKECEHEVYEKSSTCQNCSTPIKRILVFLSLLTMFLPSFAWDIIVDGIAYKITGNNEVEVGTANLDGHVFFIPEYVYKYGMPFRVTSIGACAFSPVGAYLTSVTIPHGVKSIGDYAFKGCCNLSSVTIPNSVTSIGAQAFQDCSGLTSVSIPSSVTSIGHEAFSGCSSLTSVTIPNSVTSIGGSAFAYCSGLKSVTIPNSVTSISAGVFAGCCITVYNSTCFIYLPRFYQGEYKIPNGIINICAYAFSGCKELTSVTIPNSVTAIGDGAFYNCSGLTSVTIPNSVTSVGSDAFCGCSGLTSVTIGNSVTSIGGSAFVDCSGLTSLYIPNSVTSIGGNAFNRCKLKVVILPSNANSNVIGAFKDDADFIIQKIEGRFLMPFKLIFNKKRQTRPKENNKDQGGWQRFPTKS